MTRTTSVFVLLITAAISCLVLVLGLDWLSKLLILGYLYAVTAYWTFKTETHQQQTQELRRLQDTYDQLDQQAKLILRTDLELHRIQEELDRKLTSLFALHELGQQLRVSLHPDEIYAKLNAQLISSFGFSRGLVAVRDPSNLLTWRALVGISEQTAAQIREHIRANEGLGKALEDPTPRKFDAHSANDPAIRKLLELLESPAVVIAGIKPHTGPAGCLILASKASGMTEWRGDEELTAILVTQLVVAIENSALYEELWRSRQELEHKIQDRTRELASANEQLIRLNKAKSDFVSAVSHELRTPLAAIKGYAALLLSGQFGALKQAQAERLAKIEKHTDLLTQLINNLLDIARIESGRVMMEPRAINIQEFFASVIDVLKPQLDAKHLRLALDVDGVTRFVADPTHLPRVFVNLLSNAVKYTPEGGTITVTVQQQGDTLVSTVKDQGCGIAPHDLPKLFQEFYRAANPVNEHVRGTGLGLALAKRIVEAHQGQIWVTSEVDKGTTFTFTLPAELPEPAAPQHA